MAPDVSDVANGLTPPPDRKSSTQSVSPALLQAAAQMSAHDSSESPPDAHEQDQEADREDGGEHPTKRQKRSRACQACRNMKIRCLPVEGQEACKACSKVNRQCVMPGPARKRQKTVHKVAELEKKIDALTASLAAKATAVTAPTPPTDSPATVSTSSTSKVQPPPSRPEKEYSWDQVMEQHYPALDDESKTHPPEFERQSVLSSDGYEDVITRGVFDEEVAARIYDHWKLHMCPSCPIVAFSDKIDVEWLRRRRPMTLLAIFAVASGIVVPEFQPDLVVELARQLADRVMFYNEKSMDLIQAMLVYTSWYGKHKFAKDLSFNHYLHSSVAMALDLGLGKRSRQPTTSDPEDAEIRRTWMGCYYQAGSVATVLRLPPLLNWSPYMEECLESMAKHPSALPTDNLLCCMVRLTHLVADVGVVFHMDDPGFSIPINDTSTQYQLKGFKRQLEEWESMTRPHLPDAILRQFKAVTSLYIHEIALHNEHNVDDFRPMYRATGRETPNTTKDFLTSSHFESLTTCVDAMDRALRAFQEIDIETLRGLPSIHTVWTAYVAVAMIRLHGVLNVPDSKYGPIFLPKMNVGAHLDAIIHKLSTVVADVVRVPAETFIIAFKKLKAWFVHRTIQQRAANDGITQPVDFDNASYVKAYNRAGDLHLCHGVAGIVEKSPLSSSTANDVTQQPQQAQQAQQQQQLQFSTLQQQPYSNLSGATFPDRVPTPLGANSTLLDPNANIDASTFDIQNWDFSIGELNNFDTYLNESGWMMHLV